MYLLFDILLVLLGAAMFWYRRPLGSYMARVQQDQARSCPWLYPGRLGRRYTSEKAWRTFLIPALAVAFLLFGLLWLWKGVY
jgi:uncharacterized iron-regulated membrane protein